jgi:hypothetical protein
MNDLFESIKKKVTKESPQDFRDLRGYDKDDDFNNKG